MIVGFFFFIRSFQVDFKVISHARFEPPQRQLRLEQLLWSWCGEYCGKSDEPFTIVIYDCTLESNSRQISCRYDGNPAKKIKSIAFGNGDFNIWMLHFPILVVTELGRICSIQENLYLVLNSSKFKNSTVGSIRQNNKYGFVSKILTVCQQQNPIRSHFPCLYFTQPQVTIRRSKHVNFKWEKALKDQLLENDFCLEI